MDNKGESRKGGVEDIMTNVAVEKKGKRAWYEWFFVVVLLLYPFRHVNIGLDLWDTGYSYANFLYMGMEHMDPMWLFSTYLANVIGHIFTLLPGGETLLGMNIYTSVFVSALALTGYFFCTGKLRIPAGIVFLGEFVAVSLCWCPTAVLYNYVTYVFYLCSVIFLYRGLAERKNKFLFVAGVLLGTNVLVRFSNLAQAAMIVGVWAYGVICGLEESKEESTNGWKRCKAVMGKSWSHIWRDTLWCLGGYLAALAVCMGYMALRYGLDEYVQGILQLFTMTEGATDYKPTSMIYSLFDSYIRNLYWFKRLFTFVFIAFVICNVGKIVLHYTKLDKRNEGITSVIRMLGKVLSISIGLVMCYWMLENKFYSLNYALYHSMQSPVIVFLMVIMLLAVINVLLRRIPKEEKLISGLVILIIIITSLGSNNGVFPSINNLFIAAPFAFWQFWKICMEWKAIKLRKLELSVFPIKAVLGVFLALMICQSVGFGTKFVFVETRGATQTVAEVSNNEVLAGIKMNPERAEWLEELTAYVQDQGLQGQEVILYGQVPSLSFYLQMPSAFNPWSDLRSYTFTRMQESMGQVSAELRATLAASSEGDDVDAPVVIVEKNYYETVKDMQTNAPDATDAAVLKWSLIGDFMEEFGYGLIFENEKFVVFEMQ